MNGEMKAKWLEALRSGEYKQGKGYLRRDNKFCCLGVLCDLVDRAGWRIGVDEGGGTPYLLPESVGYPPNSILEQVGIEIPESRRLAILNDDGYDFDHIANEIEDTL